jgi:hypothetical protein
LDASPFNPLSQGATLIAASHHLAHSIKVDFAHAARAQGKVAWVTPLVLTWPTYVRNACLHIRQSKGLQLRLLTDHQSSALWEQIVDEFNDRQQLLNNKLLNPSQAARDAQRSWNRLHQYRIDLQKLSHYPFEETEVFLGWLQRFIQRTKEKQWLDSARFVQFLIDQQFQPETELLVYGFDAIKPDMQYALSAWQSQGAKVTYIKKQNIDSALHIIGIRDEKEEIKQAAVWARELVTEGSERVAVVVPRLATHSAKISRIFSEVFSPNQRRIDISQQPQAFHLAVTSPLIAYPLVQHALLCLQMMTGSSDVLSVGLLLRSPFFKGYYQEASQRALLDLKLRGDRRERWTAEQLQRISAQWGCLKLAESLQAAIEVHRNIPNRATPSEWSDFFITLLKSCGWSQGRGLDSHEHQTFHKLQEVMVELGALDEVLGVIDANKALSTLRGLCSKVSFSPEAVDQPVTIIDSDGVTGMTFDAIWVMGLHAGEWPPTAEPDPFIPVSLQRSAKMNEAVPELCLAASKQKLYQLARSAKKVVFSWPQHEEGEELRPSSLLAESYPSAEGESLSVEFDGVAKRLFDHRPTLEGWQDQALPVLNSVEVKGGTRILELQSQCPFRAQVELRLHANPVNEISVGVSPVDRGDLVHRVLDEVWNDLKSHSNLVNTDLESYQSKIRAMAHRHAQSKFKAEESHRQNLLKIEIDFCVRWITDLLHIEKEREPFRVYRAEEKEAFELAGLTISIKPDRVDELADGSRLLIDYKTSASYKPSDWFDTQNQRPRSPQLPMYALAHSAQAKVSGVAFASLSSDKVGFSGLADRGIVDGIFPTDASKVIKGIDGISSWDDVLSYWQHVLSHLADEYRAGHAQVSPHKNACNYCHLKGMCRIQEFKQLSDLDNEEDGEEEGSYG